MAAQEENRLLQLRAVWQKDLFENVVPFWLEHGLDEEHGGYFTCLDDDGSVYDETKYMWLNGRALYTFARLYCEFPGSADRPAWRRAAELGAPFLDKALDDAGRLFFSTTRAGERLHFQRKPYAAVFYAQGLLQYSRMLRVIEDEGGEPHHDDADAVYARAAGMFERLLEWIDDPTKCGRPPRPPSAAEGSSLADLMCVASLSLDFLRYSSVRAATREKHAARIADVQRRALVHYDRSNRVFMEAATPDGVDHATPAGRLFVPGHSIEVAWFLLQTCEEVANEPLEAVALDALEGSLERGWDDHHGGLFYMLDVENKPLVDATARRAASLLFASRAGRRTGRPAAGHRDRQALVAAHRGAHRADHGPLARRRRRGPVAPVAQQGPGVYVRPLRHGQGVARLPQGGRHAALPRPKPGGAKLWGRAELVCQCTNVL